jgi:hypothetical protein
MTEREKMRPGTMTGLIEKMRPEIETRGIEMVKSRISILRVEQVMPRIRTGEGFRRPVIEAGGIAVPSPVAAKNYTMSTA